MTPTGERATTTKADVVDRVREATGLAWSESSGLVEAVLEVMKATLADGGTLKISGFGSFVVRAKHVRRGRNPQTSEALEISARRVLTFKPSLVFRKELNRALLREGS